ncbi:hypothetical protein BKA70DRAFT_1300726 [Coprinopsis sp. MPI-PUGE-AT-0042]|nr:hypothetical protein BKA70DRAFT_1300726 [Coprinopsis sp. MPI-PUGE-AT-0042]
MSTVDELLVSNDPIPDALVQVVQHEHAQIGRDIVSIQQEIEALQAKMSMLLRRKEGLEGVLGPIRNVPNEILSHIFLETLQQPLRMKWDDRQDLSNLRCVSKRWNNAALGTPMLWRAWEGGSRQSVISAPLFIPKLATLFARGGKDAPLRLSVNSWIQDDEIDTFVSFITGPWAWDELILTLSASTWTKILSQIRKCQLWRTIRRLSIRITDLNSDTFDVDLRECLPSLDFLLVHLQSSAKAVARPQIQVNHSGVTSLAYGRIAVNHAMISSLIPSISTSSLRNLILDNLQVSGGRNHVALPISSPTILPRIEQVVMRGFCSLLCHFTFPHLQSLQVINGTNYPPETNPFYEFLQRSSFELKLLSLEHSNLGFWGCGAFINHTSSCQILRVSDGQFLQHVYASQSALPTSLTTIVSASPFFTNLRNGQFDSSLLKLLRNFLQYRRQVQGVPNPLNLLTPETLPLKKIGPNERALLKKLREEGLLVLCDSRGLEDGSTPPHWDYSEFTF